MRRERARKVKEINPDVKVVLMTSFEIKDIESSMVFPSTQIGGSNPTTRSICFYEGTEVSN